MKNALLFLPDISGFTEFVQTTEVNHSQHVIAELLEVLIAANTQDLILAEVEGDALFFYKEEVPSLEKLLAQIETMFTAFYSHLKLLEKNRICPCQACSTAPQLELKIVAHSGPIEFISIQGNRKPYGPSVIEAHRLLKNDVSFNNYVLLSEDLMKEIGLDKSYMSKLYTFNCGTNTYNGKEVVYGFSQINKNKLKLKPFQQAKKVHLNYKPQMVREVEVPISADQMLELISNFKHRKEWSVGADDFLFNENEITRIGTEHVCVISDKHLNFVTVTKDGKPEELIYGEYTTDAPVKGLYSFFIITPITHTSCRLKSEVYFEFGSIFQRVLFALVIKKAFSKNFEKSAQKLLTLAKM